MNQPEAAFEAVPPTAASHFRLYWFAAVSRVLARTSDFDGFPFLAGYHDELAALGAAGLLRVTNPDAPRGERGCYAREA